MNLRASPHCFMIGVTVMETALFFVHDTARLKLDKRGDCHRHV